MKISTPVFYSKRNLGIDLLRIVSMMMIICLHTLGRSDLLTAIEESSGKYAFVWLIEILSYCAVDCFILISGYVGAHSDFRLSRILSIYIQVIFYNVLFALIYQIMGDDFQIIRTLKSFMPLTTKAYWFFNCYFILSIFMPFINELVKNLTYHQRIFGPMSRFSTS